MIEKNLIVIVGPTAIGKTSLSIALANYFETEILSADSRQFFREMHIGTAAPSEEELSAAPHHFIRHKSVLEDYSVGDFERDAVEKLEVLFQKYEKLIMVGGSGLYVDAVVKGLDRFPEVDPSIRQSLNERIMNEGIASLQNELRDLDPLYFSEVDLQNPHRLIRALEICIATGKPYSSFRKNSSAKRPFRTTWIGLTAERETIYDRINRRVDLMIEEGLVEEVQSLCKFRNQNALNTVGYKEIFSYLDGQLSLEEAKEEIKKNTRRFAKRQLTWFRKNKEIHWFDYKTAPEEVAKFVEEKTIS